ncbi:heavy metal translocating P-type ATPase [Methanochimaera problematica]|nr:cation-translocating P-type ATPase [Methanoplanus sp. FWC-SCC4]
MTEKSQLHKDHHEDSCKENCCAHDHSHDKNTGCGCGCGHTNTGKDRFVHEIIRFTTAGILIITIVLGEFFGLLKPEVIAFIAILSLVFTGIPIISNALRGLLKGKRNVCELAALAIVAAVAVGEYTIAAEVGFIMAIGEIAESYAYNRSKRDIEKIAKGNPRYAFVKKEGQFVELPVNLINVGDTVLVRPGDIVPADGKIVLGNTSIDESCLSGESIPVEKQEGEAVFSGTVNQNGSVEITVLKKGEDSTYSKIVKLVKEAEQRRPPSHPFIDRFAKIYTPLILVIVIFVWLFTGSIERAITVLIVACPCALLMATPSAILAATGAGAKKGILIKSGQYLESADKIDEILLDKTGTITSGQMRVAKIITFNGESKAGLLKTAAGAETGSEHPIAKAIVSYATENGIETEKYSQMNLHAGLGIEAESESSKVFAGNIHFIKNSGIRVSEDVHQKTDEMSNSGITSVIISRNNEIIGILGIEDTIRPESAETIETLEKMGIKNISMLTGDNEAVAHSISKKCRIKDENVYSGLLPAQKREMVESLQKNGMTVCFVGDGTNDGPALAQADVGVGIGSRENTVALETSHVVLLRNGLKSLADFIRLGKRTTKIIKYNVIFAMGLSGLMVLLAGTGIITPSIGAIGHQVATLAVLINSARLGKFLS